ncbi:hypothetical protein AA0114_g5620 [Alternaria tenuissima]|uniref:BTB domain-containing protein n=1 Tax=Alternaria tenuissima TaxID=119927 RepID=A0A4Q4MH11_9PLEO|nr:hypothetical protein AA0114_g5620 [Alternaria tenuissima]
MSPGLPNPNLAATTESPFDLDDLDDISDWDTDQLSPSFSLSARLQIHRSTSLQTEGMSSATISTPKAMPPLHSVIAQHGAIAAIIVEVGPDRRKYHVQKAFLTHYSEYFSKALNGAWKEAKDKIIRLTDIEPAIFGLFIEWLYTQNLPNLITLNANKIDLSSRLWKIKLYIFADRFAVSRLRTALNLEIVKLTMPLHTSIWDYASIVYAFANLPSTDPLLDFFVDFHYAYWDDTGDESQDKDRFDELPREFLLRFFKRVERRDVLKSDFVLPALMISISAATTNTRQIRKRGNAVTNPSRNPNRFLLNGGSEALSGQELSSSERRKSRTLLPEKSPIEGSANLNNTRRSP